jgi:hypothetical protein
MKALVAIMMSCALFAFDAAYAAGKNKPIVKADTKEAFEPVAANLRKEMEPGGQYGYVKPDERAKVEAGLAEMGKLFDANGSVAQMDKASKVELFNAQEVVNSILTLRDRDRLICERGAPAGSRIVSTSCHTYGELEAMQQASRKFMDEKVAQPCNAGSCAGK